MQRRSNAIVFVRRDTRKEVCKLIKKIDNLGRVVVPKGYRQMLGLKPGDPLDVEVASGAITISPHREGCIFCDDLDVVATYSGKSICRGCLDRIRSIPDA